MCNCGNKRSELTNQSAASRQSVNMPTQRMGPDVSFMYNGQSALTVTGNVTGKRYRFSGHEDKQMIDYRDVPSMLAVPVLRRVG